MLRYKFPEYYCNGLTHLQPVDFLRVYGHNMKKMEVENAGLRKSYPEYEKD